MTQRKCGTCRFFEDRELAGSGWCTNPRRRELHDMVMVRKTELACRNSWDQDLWEAAAVDQLGPSPNGAREHNDGALPLHAIPPPTVDDASGADAARNDYTDKIQSIGVPLTAPEPPVKRPAPPADAERADGDDAYEGIRDPRTAVRDAQRRRQQQLDALRGRDGAAPRRPSQPIVPDVPSRAPAPTADADVVPIARAARVERVKRDIPIPPPLVEGLPPATPGDTRASAPRLPEQPAPAPRRRPAQPPAIPPVAAQHTEQLPTAAVRAMLRSSGDASGERPLPARRVERPVVEQRSSEHSDRRRDPAARADGVGRLPVANVEMWTGLDAQQYVVTPTAPAQPALQRALPADPIDTAERLRAVQRCCGTCRSFRRDGDGERGWCENAHAFPERRMVQSSQLACRSSIGTWWLPLDELWLERADITHHGRPTPLMDDLWRGMMLSKQAMEARDAEA